MERAHKAMLIAAEVAASATTIYIAWRILAGPDANRRLLMRVARISEDRCMRNAQTWANLADKSSRLYEHGRGNVTV
jgi:hypothetical protein